MATLRICRLHNTLALVCWFCMLRVALSEKCRSSPSHTNQKTQKRINAKKNKIKKMSRKKQNMLAHTNKRKRFDYHDNDEKLRY